jgi:hypothetical protein
VLWGLLGPELPAGLARGASRHPLLRKRSCAHTFYRQQPLRSIPLQWIRAYSGTPI